MLTHIHIRHFIIVKSLSLDFQDGLHVLTGETGAGKGMVARELHERGNRRKYVEVNCAALN